MGAGLESFHTCSVDLRLSQPAVCPSLRSFSTSGSAFPSETRDFFSPRSLPRLQTLAHLYSRTQRLDLSSLPAAVRVVANYNARDRSEAVADNTLYVVRFDTIMPDEGRQGTLGDCLNADKIFHLCLMEVHANNAERELLRALRDELSLANLRTLHFEPDAIPVDGELAAFIKMRRIQVFSQRRWNLNSFTGPIIPLEWEGSAREDGRISM
ncbi:hypothetical protein JCM10908_004530 [Rhodotorula pacifica]|uniref:uncharacterized protein n=1 Tax=Rhodotorula pacifica TaxID=1495444 RepID=UPI00317CA83A